MSQGSTTFGVGQQAGSGGATQGNYGVSEDLGLIGVGFGFQLFPSGQVVLTFRPISARCRQPWQTTPDTNIRALPAAILAAAKVPANERNP